MRKFIFWAVFIACILIGIGLLQTPNGFEYGYVTIDGIRIGYVCRYAFDIIDGEKVFDMTICVGRLSDGRRIEIDNGQVLIFP